MEFASLVNKLISRLQKPLPGHEAHILAAPKRRLKTEDYLSQNPSYKSGCVIILIFPDEGLTRMVLMERADAGNIHSGQISFPGGRREMDDRTLEETALRETYEEVGIDPAEIKIIGRLSDLYIPVSNYLVHPFLAITQHLPLTKLNEAEVKSILLPPIDIFMIDALKQGHFHSQSGELIDAPYYPYESHKIWGATAMMISELVYVIKN